MLGDDATHAVAGLPAADGTETLVAALGRLRAAGATALGAALPAEGDPVGLGGPRDFNAAALEAARPWWSSAPISGWSRRGSARR